MKIQKTINMFEIWYLLLYIDVGLKKSNSSFFSVFFLKNFDIGCWISYTSQKKENNTGDVQYVSPPLYVLGMLHLSSSSLPMTPFTN